MSIELLQVITKLLRDFLWKVDLEFNDQITARVILPSKPLTFDSQAFAAVGHRGDLQSHRTTPGWDVDFCSVDGFPECDGKFHFDIITLDFDRCVRLQLDGKDQVPFVAIG